MKETGDSFAQSEGPAPSDSEPIWDLFVCHASEDKGEVARPLESPRKATRVINGKRTRLSDSDKDIIDE